MKIWTTKRKPNYKKISKELKKMIYGAAFDCHGDQHLNQLPIIVDALSYFIATCDGNAFSGEIDGKQFHQQYDKDSKQILILGIQEYMKKNRIDYDVWGSNNGLKYSLDLCIKELEKKEAE
jgi:hypothetical protein